jgi:ribose-phosphate pyrophosphokinase
MKITNGTDYLKFDSFIFPAGEIGLKLRHDQYNFFWKSLDKPNQEYTIIANVRDSNDLFRIALAKDALERLVPEYSVINLFLPYIPYARQDRICDNGESFSLKVFADYLNNLCFNKVTVVDPHSLVSEALIENVKVISQLEVFINWDKLKREMLKGYVFVAPDAGSNKKTSELASFFQHKNFIRADKLRNLSTGEIKETIVYCDDLQGQDVMISDDLCEKGGTFLALAKELKKKNAGKIALYVTHGIFSHEKSVNILLENGIDEIWTTNSYQEQPLGYYPTEKVNILNLEKTFGFSIA